MRIIGIWIITALAVAAAVYLVPGVSFQGQDILVSTLVFAAILALLNTVIKPILKLITLPITFLTLGLFAFVLNAIMLYIAQWIGNTWFGTALHLENFVSALIAALIISIATAILGALTGANKKDKRE
jgi:putative membrane protein